jgi:hypothetical protein
MEVFFFFYFIFIIIFACIGTAMGEDRAPGKLGGFLLGFFLGLIGILILFCLPKKVNENNNNQQQRAIEQTPKEVILPKTNIENNEIVYGEPTKECPYCFELIKKHSNYCRFCKRDISYASDDTPVFPMPEDFITNTKTSS